MNSVISHNETSYIGFDSESFERELGKEIAKQKLDEIKWQEIRAIRDQKLRETDWTQLTDTPPSNKQFKDYRKKLRDLPTTYTNPDEVVWPEMPTLS